MMDSMRAYLRTTTGLSETTGDERRMYEIGYVFESFEGKEPYSIDRVV